MTKLQDKIYMSITITMILFFLYYLVYSSVELYADTFCKLYICFEFLPFGDFLAIWVAIVGLFLVVQSLEEWKGQYKFEKAQRTIKKVEKILNGLNRLLGHTYVLINESRRVGHSFAFEEYKDKLQSDNLDSEIYLLRIEITDEKNNFKQEQFEKIIEFAEMIEFDLTSKLRNLHWNDCSLHTSSKNTEDAEKILKDYDKKLKRFVQKYFELRNDLYI
ncbi:hypothetical protein [Acinetobacter piscicola]|uniref:hypothetical protein n=1 Tax=Acinetobacter piscicola TaxID=2006115 RepID=UPI000B7FCD1A|nr:hypothetical protein [Acinetobacter piscicola]